MADLIPMKTLTVGAKTMEVFDANARQRIEELEHGVPPIDLSEHFLVSGKKLIIKTSLD